MATTTKPKANSFLELTPEELAEIDKQSKNLLKSCYMIDFTEKKLNNNYGFGKINAFVDGNKLNPKLESCRKGPNSQYIKKNKAILAQSNNIDYDNGHIKTIKGYDIFDKQPTLYIVY